MRVAATTPAFLPHPLAELVERAKTGDWDAIDNLLARIRPLLVRYCRARIGPVDSTLLSAADDIAQEACLAVLLALPSYRSTSASFLGFVYGIATHKITDFYRKHAQERSISSVAAPVRERSIEHDGSEYQLLRSELGEQLAAMLSKLPHTQREVLTLRLFVGLSVADTALAKLRAKMGGRRM